jgi:hypothetical protein
MATLAYFAIVSVTKEKSYFTFLQLDADLLSENMEW